MAKHTPSARGQVVLVDDAGNAKEEYLIGLVEGGAEAYCESIVKGCKPVASMLFKKRFLPYAVKVIEAWGCQWRVSDRSDEWADFSIYIDDAVGQVLTELDDLIPEGSTPFFEWAKGKLFGYGDKQINEHVSEHISEDL